MDSKDLKLARDRKIDRRAEEIHQCFVRFIRARRERLKAVSHRDETEMSLRHLGITGDEYYHFCNISTSPLARAIAELETIAAATNAPTFNALIDCMRGVAAEDGSRPLEASEASETPAAGDAPEYVLMNDDGFKCAEWLEKLPQGKVAVFNYPQALARALVATPERFFSVKIVILDRYIQGQDMINSKEIGDVIEFFRSRTEAKIVLSTASYVRSKKFSDAMRGIIYSRHFDYVCNSRAIHFEKLSHLIVGSKKRQGYKK